MNRQARMLVVDDHARWRDFLRDLLQDEGFHVDTAATVAEARQRLEQTFYHLLLLDIRMTDDVPDSVEGMDFLREMAERGLSSAMQIIMLSAYGTKEQMRSALRDYRVADFLDKDEFDDLDFARLARHITLERLRTNLALEIIWEPIEGAKEAVLSLTMADGRVVRRDHPVQQRVAAELDDLLCRLFCQADRILVGPFGLSTGDNRTLRVQPFYTTGAGAPVIVRVGSWPAIAQEYSNYETYLQPFLGQRSTVVREMRRTPLLGGLVYSLGGTEGVHFRTFGDFYREADVPQIRAALDDLFLEVCATWYAKSGMRQLCDLTNDYREQLGLTYERVEQAIAMRLESVQRRERLQFSALVGKRTFTNPILNFANQHFVRPTYVCIMHGNLDKSNILIDDTGRTCLIDFERAGPGHILRDVAALDSVVRLQLLGPEQANLEDRLCMEDALCSIDRFSEVEQAAANFSTENTALAKAYATVVHLRSLARRLLEPNPSDDISELYIALLYHALNMLRFYQLPTAQREHALLSASLLIDAVERVYAKRVEQLEVDISELDWLSRQRFEFLATASHELSRPLGHIKATLEDALAGQYGYSSAALKEKLERALKSTNHELDLIKRMFDLTSLEAGKVKVQLGPCNVLDCIRTAVEENRAVLQGKGLMLVEELPQTGIMVLGDSLFLTRSVSNILNNATKFTEKGRIGIRCAQIDDWVRIEVWDTGIGIPSDKLPHIFDPYYQVDRSLARRYEGLGAGLYLVKKWLQLHGGTIEAESSVGIGSIFRIRLPIHSRIASPGTTN